MPEETYSSSPHLYTELDIPTDAAGTVGAARVRSNGAAKRDAKRPAPEGGGGKDRQNASAPSRASRSRQRTRGGTTGTVHPAAFAAGTEGSAAGTGSSSGTAESGDPAAEAGHSGPRRRRRRRPRSGGDERLREEHRSDESPRDADRQTAPANVTT
jgi:hypothetical protein